MNKIEKVRSVADIKDLIRDSHDTNDKVCHWGVEFCVKIPDVTIYDLTPEERKELGIEDAESDTSGIVSPWATDELVIQAGPDGMEAISWLIAYTQDPEQYGMPVLGFRLTSINLLSEADMVVD